MENNIVLKSYKFDALKWTIHIFLVKEIKYIHLKDTTNARTQDTPLCTMASTIF
jgi:hypothetical protein